MSAIPWILVSIGVLIILLAVLTMIFKRKERPKTDYYSFFIMGIIWLPMGILFQIFFQDSGMGIFFIAIGAAYTILGLAHKKDWKKNHKTWKQLSSKEQKLKIILSIILGILVFVGLVVYYIFRG